MGKTAPQGVFVNLTFRGGREFSKFLQELPKAMSAEILEMSLTAGAQIVADRAREKCPKPGARRRPGTVRLADSIRVSTVEKDAAHAVVNVGTNIPYAHLVEFGHQIVPRGKTRTRVSITTVRISKRTGKQVVSTRYGLDPSQQLALHSRRAESSGGFVAARPFLRPAFDESREEMIARIGEVMGKQIEVEARRLASKAA